MRVVGVVEGTFQLQSRGHREVLFLASEELNEVQEVGRHYALGCWKGILCGCLGGCLGWLVLGALVSISAAYPNPVPALGFGLGAVAGVLLGAPRTRVTFQMAARDGREFVATADGPLSAAVAAAWRLHGPK